MTQGIYKLTDIQNGDIYIGSSMNIEEVFKRHKRDLYYVPKSSDNPYACYYDVVNRKDFFLYEILEVVPLVNQLLEREKFYIKLYPKCNTGEYGYRAEWFSVPKGEKSTKELSYEFFEIWDDKAILFDTNIQSWIIDEDYSRIKLKEIIKMIRWFYDTFDKTKFKLSAKWIGGKRWYYVIDETGDYIGNFRPGRLGMQGCLGDNCLNKITANDIKDFINAKKTTV